MQRLEKALTLDVPALRKIAELAQEVPEELVTSGRAGNAGRSLAIPGGFQVRHCLTGIAKDALIMLATKQSIQREQLALAQKRLREAEEFLSTFDV